MVRVCVSEAGGRRLDPGGMGHVINKTVDMVPVVTLLQGAQHYKASTGFSSIKI